MRIRKNGKYLIAMPAAMLAAMLALCGCAGQSQDTPRVVLTTGFEADEVFRIETSSCTLPEVMVYLTNIADSYENAYGERIWEASSEGETMEDNVKETVLARLAKVKAMNLLAAQRGVVLDEAEQANAAQAAQTYYASLNETEIAKLGVTQELLAQMYGEYALAAKVYADMIADINPEISDDEARTITVQHILVKNYSLNENGEKVPYTEQADEEAQERIREAWQRARDGEDFALLIAEYSEDENTTYSFGKGTMESAFEEAAFNLGTDEISGIVESSVGYHVIKCISTFDREETDRNKVKIVEQRRKEVFEEQYSAFVDTLTRNMNTELWEEITLLTDEDITTDGFFEVYQEYF